MHCFVKYVIVGLDVQLRSFLTLNIKNQLTSLESCWMQLIMCLQSAAGIGFHSLEHVIMSNTHISLRTMRSSAFL